MNDVDRLARDVAFEIVLGGDRFDPADLAEQLSGVSRPEMDIFRNRVRYHSEDFAPPEYRTKDFMDRMIDAWTGSIPTEGTDVRKAFMEAAQVRDRGSWFRFADGEYRRCDKASADAMWNERERALLVGGPVDAFEVARSKADRLINEYGREVTLDRRWDSVDIETYGMTAAGHVMSVRRDVNDLAKGPEDHVYYVMYKTPNGSSSTLLSHYEKGELDWFVNIVDGERAFRKGVGVMNDMPGLSGGSLISLPPETLVAAPEMGPSHRYEFEASSVFVGANDAAMVSGRFVGQRPDTPEYNYPLKDFSDHAVARIKEATDRSMKTVLARMAALETGRLQQPVRTRKDKGVSM